MLDVGDVLAITDWFVVVTGGNPRQVRTIADEVATRVESEGAPPPRVEGRDDATWVLLDFGDLVVHVFQPEARAYYALERLWADVPQLEWVDDLDPRAVAKA
jgi:ribosome-associated protein